MARGLRRLNARTTYWLGCSLPYHPLIGPTLATLRQRQYFASAALRNRSMCLAARPRPTCKPSSRYHPFAISNPNSGRPPTPVFDSVAPCFSSGGALGVFLGVSPCHEMRYIQRRYPPSTLPNSRSAEEVTEAIVIASEFTLSTPSSRTPVAGIGESELHSEAEIYPL